MRGRVGRSTCPGHGSGCPRPRSTPRASPPPSSSPPAWLRRGRDHGLDRPAHPGGGRAAHACPSCTASRCCRCTRPPCWSPSGSGAPTRGRRSTGRSTLADELDADTVVLHPPFRWQRDYARDFVDGVALRDPDGDIRLAVENMYPWRGPRSRELEAYLPHWDPVPQPYDHVTLDLSHTSTSGSDALAMVRQLGPRLAHLHLADGVGSARDEHLVPGRGHPAVRRGARDPRVRGFAGHVVVEVATRRAARGPARARPRGVAGLRPAAPRHQRLSAEVVARATTSALEAGKRVRGRVRRGGPGRRGAAGSTRRGGRRRCRRACR